MTLAERNRFITRHHLASVVRLNVTCFWPQLSPREIADRARDIYAEEPATGAAS